MNWFTLRAKVAFCIFMIAGIGSSTGMLQPLKSIKRPMPEEQEQDIELPETKYSKEDTVILQPLVVPKSDVETIPTDLRKLIIHALSFADDKDQALQLARMLESTPVPLQAVGQDKLTRMYNAVNNIRSILMNNRSFKSILNDPKFAGALIESLAATNELPIVDVALALGTDAAARWIADKYENNEIKRTAQKRFWTASAQGDLSVLRFLLHYASEKNHNELINAQLSKTSALMTAIKRDQQAVIDYLLTQKNIDLERKDISSVTPLYYAATHGNIDLLNQLIEHGANINQKSRHGETALLTAIHNNRVPIVKRLLTLKADLNIQSDQGNTALTIATWKNNEDIVNELIRAGADLNVRNIHGDTALIIAARENHELIVDTLIKAGADLNIKDTQGVTALIAAIDQSHESIIKKLIKAGADLNIQDTQGDTALIAALDKGHESIIKKLIKAGADPNMENNSHHFPLEMAAIENDVSSAKALLETNKIRKEYIDYVLGYAAEHGYIDILKLVLEYGADVNNRIHSDHTPLWHARNSDNQNKDAIIKILVDREAEEV